MKKFRGFNGVTRVGISAEVYEEANGTYTVFIRYSAGCGCAASYPTERDAIAHAEKEFRYYGCTFEQVD